MNVRKYLFVFLMGLFAVALMSCGDSSSDGGTGQVSVALTDAPGSYEAVYVTIAAIQVHRSGEGENKWETILTPNTTFNLLDYQGGRVANLGVAELPAGTYTQMRLILANRPDSSRNTREDYHPYANYIIPLEGEPIELKVPSGYQTGIKLVHNFEVEAGLTAGLVIDFDAERSVVQAGESGKWLLKPTIKISDTLDANLTGVVTDDAIPSNPIEGAEVSAQVYDETTDEVEIVQSHLTGEDGSYRMFLEPGTYIIVAVAEGYGVEYSELEVTDGEPPYVRDFVMDALAWDELTIHLTLPDDAPASEIPPCGLFGTIKFRMNSEFGMIEVMEANYAQSGTYALSLPSEVDNALATCTVCDTPIDILPEVPDADLFDPVDDVYIDFVGD